MHEDNRVFEWEFESLRVKMCSRVDVVPRILYVRMVAFALRTFFNSVNLENPGVIVKMDELTEWISQIVVMKTRLGAIRSYEDPPPLNLALKKDVIRNRI